MNGGCKYKYVLFSLAFMSVGQCTTLFPGITQSTVRNARFERPVVVIPAGRWKSIPDSRSTKICKVLVGFVEASGRSITNCARK